jgi:serine/threonine-protein kinase
MTEPSAGVDAAGMLQTRIDLTPGAEAVPVRPYSGYEPGVVVAQKFQLVRVLGEGGMGSVWVAKNLALDVHVALKLIRAELARSVPGLEDRLLQEARAAASIEHPAVIKIFDFGLTELRDPYIAMELLTGESLGDILKRRKQLNAVRAVQTLLPITEALLAAHDASIVHRDLKPDNIFLARGAGNRVEPKVLDFGIAKFDQKTAPSLTSVGTVLGSPAYMSPEQARGEADVDRRSDVWALCVVLYEVITGRLPFFGENYNQLIYAILEGQPKTFAELGINEPLLWSIIARGLEKDRERRCNDMFELGRGLALWLLDRGVHEDICNAALKSKWLERPTKAGHASLSFFPSDPPDGHPRTVRSGEEESFELPADLDPALTSGVLVRTGVEPSTNQLFGVPYSGSGKTTVSRAKAVLPPNRRWIWFALAGAGALLSFSVAVAWQFQSVPSAPLSVQDEEPRTSAPSEPRRRRRAEPEQSVQSVIEVRRPQAPLPDGLELAPASAPAPSPRHSPPPEPRVSEPRVSEVRATAPRAPVTSSKPKRPFGKPQNGDLKNPFR